MLVLFTDHYRSGCVRRTVKIYDNLKLAEMDAIARMQDIASIEEIDVQPITSLKTDPAGVTLTRAASERSLFNATEGY